MALSARDLPDYIGDSWIGAFSITPHNTNELARYTRAITAAGAGTLAVTFYDGSTHTFTLGAGDTIQVVAAKVSSTGTTATTIVGFY